MGFSSSCFQDKSGTGSLIIDGKKCFAISHWLTSSSEEALAEVEIALKDAPFAFGPWGEQLAGMKILFVGSTSNLCTVPDCGMTPMAGESSILSTGHFLSQGELKGFYSTGFANTLRVPRPLLTMCRTRKNTG